MAYPLYARGQDSMRTANLATLIGAFCVALVLVARAPRAAIPLAPLIAWASYVNFVA